MATSPARARGQMPDCSTRSLRGSDRDDTRPPGPSRRIYLNHVAGACPEEGAAERGVGRDASDAGNLDGHPLAVLVLDLDRRPDPDHAARRRSLVDDDRAVQAIADRPDPGLQQTLVVLRRVVLEVLGEVAEPPRRRDRLNDLLAARPLQLGELRLELFLLGRRHRLGLVARHGAEGTAVTLGACLHAINPSRGPTTSETSRSSRTSTTG